jgi:anti-sigma factor RsiW
MNCAEVKSLSPLYLSGELDASRAAAVAKHVATCPSCALQLQMNTDFDALLRRAILSQSLETAALDQRIHERIVAEAQPRPAHLISRSAVIAVAASILLLLIGGLMYRNLLGNRTPTVYADAAADHHDEVIDQQPRKWIYDRAAISSLAQRNGVSASAIAALAPKGYHLECARICSLDGRPFLHLVFVADQPAGEAQNSFSASTAGAGERTREISLFLCSHKTDSLPEIHQVKKEGGKSFYTPGVGSEHLACFQTGQVTALVVTDQAGDAALKFARFAAGVL